MEMARYEKELGVQSQVNLKFELGSATLQQSYYMQGQMPHEREK